MPRGRPTGKPQPAPVRKHLEAKGVSPEQIRLAEVIGRARAEKKNWTRQQLVDASGTNNAVVSGVEAGTRDPTYTTLVKLCRALGIEAIDVT